MVNFLSTAILGASLVAAAPAMQKRGSCTFTSYDDVADQIADCSTVTLSGITVPAGETLDLSDAADGATITFAGTTTFEYSEWSGPLIRAGGKGVTITGASGHTIDGNGAKWWDGEGTNGGKTKPKFFYAHSLTGNSVIKGLNVKNTPVQAFSVQATDLTISDITIDNTDGDATDCDGEACGHNTDAFDVSESENVTIKGCTVKNQDDCLAINSGTGITFSDNTCSGGHGISIGSVGGRDDNDVANIVISGNTVTNSANGLRIKTVYDATGSVKNVTYTNNKISGISDYGIVVEQDYENGSPTGKPTSGVPITDITFDGVTGSVDSDAEEVYILCASCSDWTWSGVDITGATCLSPLKSPDCNLILTA
ncbi:putative endo-polygalacturonase [Aureobasidium pullulans]|uniref:endo-polygalacturonase n=1 Tax=Aureobasidium pullulans TaxID=5580 RepID=A0A4S8V320_AURPU|nr:putative endo-polygalacturonase [Aureobasidium pullulans]